MMGEATLSRIITTSVRIFPFLKPAGFDIFCVDRKFLVFNLVARNLKIKYRRSILGIFWTLLSPLGMAAVYYLVFKVVLNIQVEHYPAFILSGVLPWAFFAQTTSEGMESVVGSWGLLSKVPIPGQLFPFVGAVTNFVTLIISLPIPIGAAILSGTPLGPSIVLLPFYMLLLFLFTYGFSLIAAIAFVYFRDLRHLLNIFLQIWFYGTPVLYAESMIEDKFPALLYLNPLGGIFSGIHTVLIYGGWPKPELLAAALGWTTLALSIPVLLNRRVLQNIVEKI